MTKVNELMVWKFQSGEKFGFFIPEDREYYGWDFYVAKDNFWLAETGDKVEARELKKTAGKKPEAKIIKVFWKTPVKKPKFIEWIYSAWNWNFGFIDIQWEEKWYFVYGNKKGDAKDWDKVKAEIVDFKWKKEAIVVKIFSTEDEIVTWRFKDNDNFWFVIPDESKNNDIFIAWSRKNNAKDWDLVEAKIIKKRWKNPEWLIIKILN